MLARAERLNRELFRPRGLLARLPVWEPPVDVLETEREVLVLVALPGSIRSASKPSSMMANWYLQERASCLANCRPRSFIVSNCRRAGSSGGCGFRLGATARSTAPPPTAAS